MPWGNAQAAGHPSSLVNNKYFNDFTRTSKQVAIHLAPTPRAASPCLAIHHNHHLSVAVARPDQHCLRLHHPALHHVCFRSYVATLRSAAYLQHRCSRKASFRAACECASPYLAAAAAPLRQAHDAGCHGSRRHRPLKKYCHKGVAGARSSAGAHCASSMPSHSLQPVQVSRQNAATCRVQFATNACLILRRAPQSVPPGRHWPSEIMVKPTSKARRHPSCPESLVTSSLFEPAAAERPDAHN